MKCYYEVLSVQKDVNQEDLKKAYRKMALIWHPDKNLESEMEATTIFKEIQIAYDILSDPHERAFYDKHRDLILKGYQKEEHDSSCVDVYNFFNISCFQGYNDGPKGFFTVYTKVFTDIGAEVLSYYKEKDEEFYIPLFGKSDSNFKEVVDPFYRFWESYCTIKSFVWLNDIETIKSAPNRKIARMIEKDHEKVRKNARKARNEEVRELVRFVKKRDPRVKAHKEYVEVLNRQKLEAEAQKRLEFKREKYRREFIDATTTNGGGVGGGRCSLLLEGNFINGENDLDAHLRVLEQKIDELFGKESDYEDDETEICDEKETPVSNVTTVEEGISLVKEGTSSRKNGYAANGKKVPLYCLLCNKLFKSSSAFTNHENSRKHKDVYTKLRRELSPESRKLFETEFKKDHDNDSHEDNNEGKANNNKTTTHHKNDKIRIVDNDSSQILASPLPQPDVSSDLNNFNSTSMNHILPVQKDEKQDLELPRKNDAISFNPQTPTTCSDYSHNRPIPTLTKSNKMATSAATNKKKMVKCDLFCRTCELEFSSKNKLFQHINQTGHAVLKYVDALKGRNSTEFEEIDGGGNNLRKKYSRSRNKK